MAIVKKRVGMRAERCSQCHRTLVIAGMMAAGGDRLICELCAAAGLPGTRGHDLPTFAVEWSESTGEALDSNVCAREWRAWEKEAEAAERSGQPEVAALATQRSVWMLEAYQAFRAAEGEL